MAQDRKYWEEYIKKTLPESITTHVVKDGFETREVEFLDHYKNDYSKTTVLDNLIIPEDGSGK